MTKSDRYLWFHCIHYLCSLRCISRAMKVYGVKHLQEIGFMDRAIQAVFENAEELNNWKMRALLHILSPYRLPQGQIAAICPGFYLLEGGASPPPHTHSSFPPKNLPIGFLNGSHVASLNIPFVSALKALPSVQ